MDFDFSLKKDWWWGLGRELGRRPGTTLYPPFSFCRRDLCWEILICYFSRITEFKSYGNEGVNVEIKQYYELLEIRKAVSAVRGIKYADVMLKPFKVSFLWSDLV